MPSKGCKVIHWEDHEKAKICRFVDRYPNKRQRVSKHIMKEFFDSLPGRSKAAIKSMINDERNKRFGIEPKPRKKKPTTQNEVVRDRKWLTERLGEIMTFFDAITREQTAKAQVNNMVDEALKIVGEERDSLRKKLRDLEIRFFTLQKEYAQLVSQKIKIV